jgi:hypothetical protein
MFYDENGNFDEEAHGASLEAYLAIIDALPVAMTFDSGRPGRVGRLGTVCRSTSWRHSCRFSPTLAPTSTRTASL